MALVVDVEAIRSWLTARLDDDAQVAHRNTDGRGLADGFPDYRTYDDDDTAAADAYIEHFKPARALTEVAAKRRRLERHTLGGFTNVTQSPFCGWCTEGYDGRTSEPDASVLIVPWPCPDIIDDAQAYRDHAGFPAELRLP